MVRKGDHTLVVLVFQRMEGIEVLLVGRARLAVDSLVLRMHFVQTVVHLLDGMDLEVVVVESLHSPIVGHKLNLMMAHLLERLYLMAQMEIELVRFQIIE